MQGGGYVAIGSVVFMLVFLAMWLAWRWGADRDDSDTD